MCFNVVALSMAVITSQVTFSGNNIDRKVEHVKCSWTSREGNRSNNEPSSVLLMLVGLLLCAATDSCAN